jgi:mitotic spindle assembly checkpoint protein MAD2
MSFRSIRWFFFHTSLSMSSSPISLRGSSALICEFFHYSINSILYQRGLYAPDTFTKVHKYSLTLQVTNDPALTTFLGRILTQMRQWLESGLVKKLVLVIAGSQSEETLERWTFDVQLEKGGKALLEGKSIEEGKEKDERIIQQEMGAVIRQITSSVSFLPLLDEECVFDLLVYTDSACQVPLQWEESDPKYIQNQQMVKLRSISTNIHKVDTAVAYKLVDPF